MLCKLNFLMYLKKNINIVVIRYLIKNDIYEKIYIAIMKKLGGLELC